MICLFKIWGSHFMGTLLPSWGKSKQGMGRTDGHGRVNSTRQHSKQPIGRGVCNRPTQSLSSTWDLGILGWKSKATNRGGEKGGNLYSGIF